MWISKFINLPRGLFIHCYTGVMLLPPIGLNGDFGVYSGDFTLFPQTLLGSKLTVSKWDIGGFPSTNQRSNVIPKLD